MYKSERLFLEEYADKNKEYLYEPKQFKFKSGEVYTPDFYCVEDNIYIEVVGTPTCFYNNQHKYLYMEQEYPEIILELVNVGCFVKGINKIKSNRKRYVSIPIDEYLEVKLRELAELEGRRKSELINWILRKYVTNHFEF